MKVDWFALYTKPHNEIKVAEKLLSMGVEAYCPTIVVEKQWSDRKKKIQQPLLNSYVFVKLNDKERALVFAVPGVVRYLFWLGKPAIVKDSEILAIKEMLQESYKAIAVTGVQPGSTITLQEGAFKGQSATFVEQKGNKTILVLDGLGITLILER
ncbi:UpxY family transcription antiterminator [Flavobacterium sp. LMO9]|nr:UpxY family transcription antiterminator [Flavobacterium sp. LMO9]MQP61950.1 UpxY family transcription antiterminator [Flavobacterium sp. LMO6]